MKAILLNTIAAMALCACTAAAANAYGGPETDFPSAFPKWHRVITEEAINVSEWGRKPQESDLKDAMDAFSDYAYVEDLEAFGVSDMWQTPSEFKTRRRGDCEDYAIARYYFLLERGWGVGQLHIHNVRKPDGVLHAILVAKIGGKAYVLDNEREVVSGAEVLDYSTPIYRINHNGWEYIGDQH